jgi:hypothetical protein
MGMRQSRPSRGFTNSRESSRLASRSIAMPSFSRLNGRKARRKSHYAARHKRPSVVRKEQRAAQIPGFINYWDVCCMSEDERRVDAHNQMHTGTWRNRAGFENKVCALPETASSNSGFTVPRYPSCLDVWMYRCAVASNQGCYAEEREWRRGAFFG